MVLTGCGAKFKAQNNALTKTVFRRSCPTISPFYVPASTIQLLLLIDVLVFRLAWQLLFHQLVVLWDTSEPRLHPMNHWAELLGKASMPGLLGFWLTQNKRNGSVVWETDTAPGGGYSTEAPVSPWRNKLPSFLLHWHTENSRADMHDYWVEGRSWTRRRVVLKKVQAMHGR